jgi:hypothetical protein
LILSRQQLLRVILIWLGWYIALMSFQQINWARLRVERPDNGYSWTAGLTAGELDGPERGAWFYARWDSYRFVRIAQQGYSDPAWATFFPGYPLLMGMTAFAGDRLGADFAERAAFYLLIFPTAMFMVQVYTESTYLAFSVWGLFFAYRQKWLAAGILCAAATLTRPPGMFLFLPMLAIWLDGWWRGKNPPRMALLAVITPLVAFWGFNQYLAMNGIDTFEAQEDFGRYFLHPYAALALIQQIGWMTVDSNGLVQIGLDIAFTLFATGMCLIEWKHHPGLALYGLGATWVSLATGQLVSQNRYVLIVFPIFFVLARWGKHPAFDRAWTLISLLLLALYLVQFTQGLWTG